jgi:SAM-dependent methyltransferase
LTSIDLDYFLRTREGDFKDVFCDSIDGEKIQFQTGEIGIDWTYATMHFACQGILKSIYDQNRDRLSLLDVGSQFSFISFASSFFDVVMLEPRSQKVSLIIDGICSLQGVPGEAQHLPFKDSTFNIVTSLHAIEHFGLGRYGDKLDYFGDQKGIKEFSRVLSPGGVLITAVPAASRSSIEFNGQRLYSPKDFEEIVSSTGLVKMNSVISYVAGSRTDGIVVGEETTINDYPSHYTPPVLISVYQKSLE